MISPSPLMERGETRLRVAGPVRPDEGEGRASASTLPSTAASRHLLPAGEGVTATAGPLDAEFDQRLLPGLDTELSLPWPNSLSISLTTSREGSLMTGTPVSA